MIVAEPGPRAHDLGRRGEQAAELELVRRGLRVLHRRFRCRAGELDLVALDGETIVFVEVKARGGRRYGAPAESVTSRKRDRLGRVALFYLARHGLLERRCRFDLVEVLTTPDGQLSVRHVVDAFRLGTSG